MLWQVCMQEDADQGLHMKSLSADRGCERFVPVLDQLQPLVTVGCLGLVRVQELFTLTSKGSVKV